MNSQTQNFDLIVLGGGSAGTSAAFASGLFGKRVALIERSEFLGGAGANTGTSLVKVFERARSCSTGGVRERFLASSYKYVNRPD